jgi:Putative intracellular protease/amidase
MATILMPLPDEGFDLTEVAVPWRLLTDAGHEVVVATELGRAPIADPLLISGVVFGQLGAEPEPIAYYRDFERSASRNAPLRWSDLDVSEYGGLLLAGGHAPRMRQYLGSAELHDHVSRFWALDRPVGAICHGVLVLARAHTSTGRSVLAASQTTCLPKYMERAAFFGTAWRRGRYYRTYPAYVEDEVRAALADPARQFVRGPRELRRRGTATDDSPAFVVEDGRYVSARWPGDAYLFAQKFLDLLASVE